MAVFNPAVAQTNDPNYENKSRSIQQPDFKSAEAIGLKGFGNIFEEAAKGSLDYLTDQAKRETQSKFEALRDDRTSELESADRLIRYAANSAKPEGGGGNPDQPDGGGGPAPAQDILANSNTGPNIPSDATAALKGLSALKDARANGRLTATDYDGRAASLLKDIRAKYPDGSIRDTIDAEASKVFGGDPANKKIQSLTEAINSYMTNTQSMRTHVFNELTTKGGGFEGAQAAIHNFMNGGSIDDAMGWLTPNLRRQNQRAEAEADLKLRQSQGTATKEWYTLNMREGASALLQETIHSIKWNSGVRSWDDMNKMVQDAYSGKGPQLTAEQWVQMGQLPLAYKQRYLERLQQENSKTVNGFSYNGQVDPSEISKTMENNSKVFDTLHEAFASKDVGLAALALQRVSALDSQASLNLRKDADVGGTILGLKAWQSAVGDKIVEQTNLQDVYAKIHGPFKKFLDGVRNDATIDDPKWTPEFKTLKDAKEALFRSAHPDKDLQIPATFNRLVDMVDSPKEGMVNLPPQTQSKVFNFFFDPKNTGALSDIKFDGRTEKGRTSGLQSLFARFANPDVVEIAKKQGPQGLANYLDFMNTTWETNLFKPEIAKFKGIMDAGSDTLPGVDKALTSNLYSFEWDTQSHGLKLMDKRSPTTDYMRRGAASPDSPLGRAQDLVSRLNTGFRALANVAEATNQDADHYILDHLQHAMGETRVDADGKVTGFDITKIKGIPSDIIKAVTTAREAEQEAAKKTKATSSKYELK